jgi:hypothetical protein
LVRDDIGQFKDVMFQIFFNVVVITDGVYDTYELAGGDIGDVNGGESDCGRMGCL